jgi:hypothetical protein
VKSTEELTDISRREPFKEELIQALKAKLRQEVGEEPVLPPVRRPVTAADAPR